MDRSALHSGTRMSMVFPLKEVTNTISKKSLKIIIKSKGNVPEFLSLYYQTMGQIPMSIHLTISIRLI